MSRTPGRLPPGFAAKLGLLLDLGVVGAALVGSTLLMGHEPSVRDLDLWLLWGMAGMSWMLAGTVLGLYVPRFSNRALLEDMALVSLTLVSSTLMFHLERLLLLGSYPVSTLTSFPLLLWVGVTVPRWFVLRRLALREDSMDTALIVGTGSLGRRTGEHRVEHGHRVAGYLAFGNEKTDANSPQPLLGAVEQLEDVLRRTAVDVVYICGDVQKHAREMQGVIELCERFGVPFALPARSFRMSRAHPLHGHTMADGYQLFVTHTPRPHLMAAKRLFDIIMSLMALVALAPLLLAVAFLIRLTSTGPIFFKQLRFGQNGRPFYIWKFRSMVVNAEELKAKLAALNAMPGPVFKLRNDPRVTGIGRILRTYGIDDLPQLLNVLRGEMSLVGPRPPLPGELARYEPWQRRQLSMRPGLIAMWQVHGSDHHSFEERMYQDMLYIDHWTPWLDLSILVRAPLRRVHEPLGLGYEIGNWVRVTREADGGSWAHLTWNLPANCRDLATELKTVLLDLHPTSEAGGLPEGRMSNLFGSASDTDASLRVTADVQALAARLNAVLLDLHPESTKGAGHAGS